MSFIFTAVATALLSSAAWTAIGTSDAIPTPRSAVDDTVRTLEAEGYNVIINRAGAAPLSRCDVAAVRPARTHLVTKVTPQTVYVDVSC
ncbi:MAG TPA: hypothetical protein VHH12_09165 [Mycobacterium sp.]|nr:hypothetical protein [Mycobacterium sp.]